MQSKIALALLALYVGCAIAVLPDHPLALLNKGRMLASEEGFGDDPPTGLRPDLDHLFTCEGVHHLGIYLFINCNKYYSANTRCFNAQALFSSGCDRCAKDIYEYTKVRIGLDCEDYDSDVDYHQCPPGFQLKYGECFQECDSSFECCQDGESCKEGICRRDSYSEQSFLAELEKVCGDQS